MAVASSRRVEGKKSAAKRVPPDRVQARPRVPAAAPAAVPPGFVPLARSLGYHVRELSESWSAAMDTAAQSHGISLTQWRYLRELWEEDRLTSGELTKRVGREGPTTVVAVRSLERAGLVRMVKSGHDRRKTFICLTAQGRRLAALMTAPIQQINDMAIGALTEDEVKFFKKLVVKMQRTLDANRPSRNSWSIWRTDRLAADVGE
jgi:DNA-binding MarR family transcriptional regulator